MKYSYKILIILTKECNRDCAFCIDRPNRKYYKEYRPYIDIETVKDILEFAEGNNIKIIALNDDESTLHSQVDYLDYLNKHYPLKRNEKGDYYHDFIDFQIEREDLPNIDYDIEQSLYKAHMAEQFLIILKKTIIK